MGAFAAPLSASNLAAWEAWTEELNGARKSEFDDMNSRHDITDHRAYLQPTPDGNYLVVVVVEGDGADNMMPNIGQSDHDFDKWFMGNIVELHQLDMSAGPPPAPERRL